jgi:hypothetical protein
MAHNKGYVINFGDTVHQFRIKTNENTFKLLILLFFKSQLHVILL